MTSTTVPEPEAQQVNRAIACLQNARNADDARDAEIEDAYTLAKLHIDGAILLRAARKGLVK